ncbi:hypothetical protein [Shimia ponticola]|uniref:hypothetical protein n=1 Tax=Shimia ponticola TaxID=2582893 RepID=UPI0011BDC109|nr:hypothetical protein [Shimia ponticola]
MKGSNSRQIAAKDTQFTNLFHIQGGMVTDSDLGEGAALAQARDEALGQATIGTGIPAKGGLIDWGAEVTRLRNGTVFAQGKRGEFRLDPTKEAKSLAEQVLAQLDYPGAPELQEGAHLLYADLWDRTILAVQDPRLTDAGLHGTETSYRSQTMVQVKTVPWDGDLPAKGGLNSFLTHPAMSRTGAGELRIGALAPDSDTGGCDPCADRITVDRVLPNALWRLEVVAVQRDKEGTVTGFELAWSMENAAAVEANTTTGRQAIKRSEGEAVVYEFFSDLTEAYKGWFAGGDDVPPVPRPAFDASIDGAVIESEGGDAYIRRWDGHLRWNGSDIITTGVSNATLSGSGITINTGSFTARLAFDGREMLVGDYWLVELRRFADPEDQLYLVGATADGEDTYALPHGIDHFHCPIGIIGDGELLPPEQALAQITAFPALTDLSAHDVSYSPPDGCRVFEPFDPETEVQREVENVKEALDSLCDLDATRIAFNSQSGCETLGDTSTVAEALEALCAADDDATLRLMLRTMMDWGVICGHRLQTEPGKDTVLTLSSGTALNPHGLLQAHGDITFEMGDVEVLGSIDQQLELGLDLCLSMQLRPDASPRFFLSHEAFTRRPDDRNLEQRIRDCLEDKTKLDSSDTLKEIDETDAIALSKILTGATSRDGMGTTLMLNAEEFERVAALQEKLRDELLEDASEASKLQYQTLEADAKRRFEEASEKARDELAIGVARLAFMVELFTAMAVVERDMQAVCVCERGLIDCPTHSMSDRGLIPLAAVVVTKAGEGLAVREISNYTYRKQSHNWRSERYYFGDRLRPVLNELGDRCGGADGIDTISEALLSWNPTDEELEEAKESPYWPVDPGISNLEEINGADLRGYGEEKARSILEEASIELIQDAVFYLEEGDVYMRIAEVLQKAPTQPLNLNYEARSGDSVGMTIDREGRVADVFVVKAAPFGGYLKRKTLPEEVVTENVKVVLPSLVAEYLQNNEEEGSTGAQLGGLIGDVEGLREDFGLRGTQLDNIEAEIEDIRNNAPDLSMIPGLQAQVESLVNNPPVVPDISPVEDAIGALDTDLQTKFNELNVTIDSVRNMIPEEVNLSAIETELLDLQTTVARLDQEGTGEFDPSGLQSQIDELNDSKFGPLVARVTTLENAPPVAGFDPSGLQDQIDELNNNRFGTLEGRVTTLENAPPVAGFDPSGLQDQIDELNNNRFGTLEGRVTTLENAPPVTGFDPSGLQAQIDELNNTKFGPLEGRVDALEDAPPPSVNLGPLQDRVDQLEAENAALREMVKVNTPISLVLPKELLPAFAEQSRFFAMGQLQVLDDDQLGQFFGDDASKIKQQTQSFFATKK